VRQHPDNKLKSGACTTLWCHRGHGSEGSTTAAGATHARALPRARGVGSRQCQRWGDNLRAMALPASEQQNFRINMDGEWDIDDLRSLTSSIRLSYAYFYWALQEPMFVTATVRGGMQRYFWTGEYIGDRFANTLYEQIPDKRRVKLVSIHYASPGWMELAGFLPVVYILSLVVRSWIATFDKALDLAVAPPSMNRNAPFQGRRVGPSSLAFCDPPQRLIATQATPHKGLSRRPFPITGLLRSDGT
jgi:hypothetical protein